MTISRARSLSDVNVNLLRVCVTNVSGEKRFKVELPSSSTILDIKRLITTYFDIQLCELNLIAGLHRCLDDTAHLGSLGSRGNLFLTVVRVVDPALPIIMGQFQGPRAVDACSAAERWFGSGEAQYINESRRQVAVKTNMHLAIINTLRSNPCSKVYRALSVLCKATQDHESNVSAACRRQAIVDAGAIELLVAIIANARKIVFDTEHACRTLALLCQVDTSLPSPMVKAAQARRKRAIDVGAKRALARFLTFPLPHYIHEVAKGAFDLVSREDCEDYVEATASATLKPAAKAPTPCPTLPLLMAPLSSPRSRSRSRSRR